MKNQKLKNYKRFKGLIAATFTPFDDDGNVNTAIIPLYADFLAKSGIKGVFVCGTSGESLSLTTAERIQLAQAWVTAANKRFRVIVHVGSNSQLEAEELAYNAQEIGSDGIGMMAPTFFKPANIGELISFFKPIAASAPDLPFYYYNIPSMTGVNLSVKEFLEQAEIEIPNLAGVKFTSNNFMEMLECINFHDHAFEILNGYDECLLCGLTLGVTGGVGSTYNYIPSVYNDMIDAFNRGDLGKARALQSKSVSVVNIIIRHGGGTRGGKAIMHLLGIDCGNCRPPFSPVSNAEYNTLSKELEDVGLIKHIAP